MDRTTEHRRVAAALAAPPRLWSRAEVLARPGPVPRAPGLYAWYFRDPPARVPLDGCRRHGDRVLLYVGLAPKQPPADGRRPSRQALASRLRYHYRGNAAGSTLRLTLGCLLAAELGLGLRRVGGGRRLTFTAAGEERLSTWMGEHAFVAWAEAAEPWRLEAGLIGELAPALNLRDNGGHPFHAELAGLRAAARARARALPVA